MEKRIVLKGFSHDSLWIQAIMYFPNNEFLRDAYFISEFVQGKLEGSNKSRHQVEFDKEIIERLMKAPSIMELRDKKIEALKKGVLAGDMLASIYLMHRFKMPEPSLNKAIHISRKFNTRNLYGNSIQIPRSIRKIKEAFKEYKPVAHLWAALRLNQNYPYANEGELFFEKLTFFLEVSEGFLEFGTTFIPHRARPQEPILPNEDMWQLPEDIRPRQLESNIFPSGITHLLKDYDTKKKSKK